MWELTKRISLRIWFVLYKVEPELEGVPRLLHLLRLWLQLKSNGSATLAGEMRDRRDAGQEGFGTGGMRGRRDVG